MAEHYDPAIAVKHAAPAPWKVEQCSKPSSVLAVSLTFPGSILAPPGAKTVRDAS